MLLPSLNTYQLYWDNANSRYHYSFIGTIFFKKTFFTRSTDFFDSLKNALLSECIFMFSY